MGLMREFEHEESALAAEGSRFNVTLAAWAGSVAGHYVSTAMCLNYHKIRSFVPSYNSHYVNFPRAFRLPWLIRHLFAILNNDDHARRFRRLAVLIQHLMG